MLSNAGKERRRFPRENRSHVMSHLVAKKA
jgi:hypothetical protein